jgi:hypothetical protein
VTPATIISAMARGWESKSVEAQQAESEEKDARPRVALSAGQAARTRARETVQLARQQVLRQMDASTNPKRREQLQDALAALEKKLESLG